MEIWKQLAENGANVNFRDLYGVLSETSLIGAIIDNKYDVVEYLLDRGAEINAQTSYGSLY